ncbi:hypothetical protein [Flindersiella endophytica]
MESPVQPSGRAFVLSAGVLLTASAMAGYRFLETSPTTKRTPKGSGAGAGQAHPRDLARPAGRTGRSEAMKNVETS